MTSYVPNRSELPQIKTPEVFEEMYSGELALEDYFKSLRHRAIEAKSKKFATIQEAEDAADAYTTVISSSLYDHMERLRMPVIVTGDGILEPDTEFEVKPTTDTKFAISVELDVEAGYRPVPNFDTRFGVIEMIHVRPVSELDEEGFPTGVHSLEARYIIRAGQPQYKNVTTVNSPFDALQVQMWPAYIAEIDTVDIQSLVLHNVRKENRFQYQISQTGIMQTRFYKRLTILQEGLKRTHSSEFVPIPDIDHLKSAGRLGGIIAQNTPELAELVQESFLRVLPLGKTLQLAGASFIPQGEEEPIPVIGEVHGTVWDIQFPTSKDDPTGASIILEEKISPTTSRMHIFAFEDITGLKH
ncbi:MAG: hypothetical protein WA030_01010 [Candidatus Microsaccharimonas sp.]